MNKENKYFYEMKPVILNTLSFLLLIIMIAITYLIIDLSNMSITMTNRDLNIMWLLIIPYFIFHEVLHSIGYTVNGADFKRITFGMHIEKGILCCSCKQEIKKKTIMWSLVYPFIFIGIVTYIIGLIINSPILILLSISNITGCIGDLVMFYDFMKIKDFRFFEYDNPLAFGIVTNEDMSKIKMFGLKRIEEKNFKQTIDKKISVSKTSIIVFSIYFIMCLICLFL